MKTHSFVLFIIAVLALILLSGCNITFGQASEAPAAPPTGEAPSGQPPAPGEPPPGQPLPPGEPPPGQPPLGQPPPGEPPPGQPPLGQPPPGEPPPGQPPQPAQPAQPGCPGAPVILSFTANPSTISAGQSSTLSWGNVTNGNSAQLVKSVTITPGLGEVGSGASSRSVKPTQTTTYTLTATGCGGTATRQVTVTVTGGAAPAPTATPLLLKVVMPDLAVTNIYAKQAESWQLKFTIKNTGQGDLTNVGGSFSCSMSWIPTGSKTGKSQKVSGFLNVTLKVGQETTLDGGLTLSDVAYYDASCGISPNILDTNAGNNSKSVKITRGP